MYSTNITTDPQGSIIYSCKNKLNQKVILKFTKEEYDNVIYWNVCLYIGKKRAGFQYLKQTGKDGIGSLLWAKQSIASFKDTLKGNKKKTHIIVQWDDNRRRDVYIWALKDLGFSIEYIYSTKMLVCNIN